MPRKPRLSPPGTIHHITSRGNNRQKIFFEPTDYPDFLQIITDTRSLLPFELFAFCLMPNHFHLLVRVISASISRIMQRLESVYTHKINRRDGRVGHLFRARFPSILCENDAHFLELLRYIHLNPVRANLVELPSDWQWSGHQEFLGLSDRGIVDWKFPLSMFNSDLSRAQEAYRRFVDLGSNVASPKPIALPSRPKIPTTPASPEHFPGLEPLALATVWKSGISIAELRGTTRRRRVTAVRADFIRKALLAGARRSDLSRFLNVTPAAIWKAVPSNTLYLAR